MNPLPLTHVTKRGRVRQWRKNKLRAMAVADAYRVIAAAVDSDNEAGTHRRRSDRIGQCSQRLDFVEGEDRLLSLANGFRCKSRMCPLCQGSAARTAYAVLADLVQQHAAAYPTSLPAMLTLTVPNVHAGELRTTITKMLVAFAKLRKMKRWQRAVIGWRRALEVTRNVDTGDYHPHFHILVFLAPDYFTAPGVYLANQDWQALWMKATGLPLAIVDIRRKGYARDGKLVLVADDALAEAAKYVVKPLGVYDDATDAATVDPDVLRALHDALKSRRLYDYGGTLKQLPRAAKPDPFGDDATRHTFIWSELIDRYGEVHAVNYWPAPSAESEDTETPPDPEDHRPGTRAREPPSGIGSSARPTNHISTT